MSADTTPRTLFEKIWERHKIVERDDGQTLLYIDRHLIHDGSRRAFEVLAERGLPVRRPDRTFGTPDHYVPTDSRSLDAIADPEGRRMVEAIGRNAKAHNVTIFGLDDPRQGIIHVVGPEQGLTQPGLVMVCGDSHTSTHGALGALAFGIGASEVAHVLATQTLWQRKPKTMRITVDGALGAGVTGKDVILAIIAKIGTAGAVGHAIEYAGSTIRALSMEGRFTVCNMSIEAGARAGMIAPDDTTIAYVEGRPYAPKGPQWEAAAAFWRRLPSDPGARFEREVALDGSAIAPMVTWGTSPEDAAPITARVPDPAAVADGERRAAMTKALDYMGLAPGTAISRDPRAARLHRLLHQQPHRGSQARGARGARAQGRGLGPRHGGAGLRPGEAAGGGGRARPRLHRRRLRVAERRLLHVRRHERRPGGGRRSLRLHLEPEFRRPPGQGSAHPPREPDDGGSGGGHRPLHRRARAARELTRWNPSSAWTPSRPRCRCPTSTPIRSSLPASSANRARMGSGNISSTISASTTAAGRSRTSC